jgi:methylated-DNA-[protein]-cysteine S-methyltransferase
LSPSWGKKVPTALAGELKYFIADTELGWVGILGSSSGLRQTTLPCSSAEQAERLLGNGLKEATLSEKAFAGLVERLKSYLAGKRVEFPDAVDLSRATPFQRRVWKLTRLIPYGETRSYGWIAEKLGKSGAGRAVGQALAKNPLPIIIPCHRVVARDGSLAGYSGGIEMKRHLLKREGDHKA